MMKTIYLIRHAKSSWSSPELSDFDRPLNKRGKHDAPFMGRLLHQRGIVPDYFLSSPARRAIATAKKIAKEINYPVASIVTDKQLYLASADTLLSIIRDLSEAHQAVFMVGHNPGITDLANVLGDKFISNIPTCGIAILESQVAAWKEVQAGNGILKQFEYPKKYTGF